MAGKCARCRATLTVGVAFSPLPTTQILMPLHGVARVFSREWGHVCQANRCPSFAKMRLSGPGWSADSVPLLARGGVSTSAPRMAVAYWLRAAAPLMPAEVTPAGVLHAVGSGGWKVRAALAPAPLKRVVATDRVDGSHVYR
jgi:hypothetical protein